MFRFSVGRAGRSQRRSGFRIRSSCIAVVAAVASAMVCGRCSAAAVVRLEVFAESSAPAVAQHEWVQRLAEVGVTDLRFRAANPGDRIAFEQSGTAENRIYRITGRLDSRGNLILPNGVYRPSEVRRVAEWLKELAEKGPPEAREKNAAFGLTETQLRRLQAALGRPCEVATKGMRRDDAIRGLIEAMPVQIKQAASIPEDAGKVRVEEDLSPVSTGTALAYLLDLVGLAFAPSHADAGCRVIAARPGAEVWPVGRTPEKAPSELIPDFYKAFNANLDRVSVRRVVDSLGKRLSVPVLWDYRSMAAFSADPNQTTVSVTGTRTTYSSLLSKVLGKAKLRFEVRVDDAGKPFLWVTTQRSLP